MNCPNCGGSVPTGNPRCIKCGSFVGQQQTNIPPPPLQYTPAQNTSGYKSRTTAGLLGIFLGGFGIHRFYLGYTGIGIAQIAVSLVTWGIGALWGFIEGVLILTGTGITSDASGNPLST